MKVKSMFVSTMLACALLAGGTIGVDSVQGLSAQAQAADNAPASVTLTAETLNAGTVSSNPWKQMFDYWSNAGSVTYTGNGVVIEGTNSNAMNLINGPMSVADGARFEMVFGIPYYNRADTADDTAYVRKMTINLMNASSTIAAVTIWGDSYDNNNYVSADFSVGSESLSSIQLPKSCMEEGSGVRLGFDLEKGWYADIVDTDGAEPAVSYQAVADDGQFDAALSAITVEEITRVQAVRHEWETAGVTSTKVVLKELNGQDLCLKDGALTVSDSFNVSSLKMRESNFLKGETYTFELVSVAANDAAVNTAAPENDPAVYALIHLGLMGDIGWNSDGAKGEETNSGIRVTLSRQDGSVVSDTLHKDSWGKAGQTVISFTMPEAGDYTLALTFVTVKGNVTVRTADITVDELPYIALDGMPAAKVYEGEEVVLPGAVLMDNGEEVQDISIDVSVTLNGSPVDAPEGAFTVQTAGTYVIIYTAEYGGEIITKTVEVTAVADTVVSIRIETPPTKTTYVAGESFDRTGMVVIAVYESGKEAEITDYTVSKDVLAVGDTSVVIDYQGKKTPQSITVTAEGEEDPAGQPSDGSGGCGGSISGAGIGFLALAAGVAGLGVCLRLRKSRRNK